MTPDAAALVVDILDGRADTTLVLERLRAGIEAMDPWDVPAREPGLLLSALAATTPGAISPEIGTACATVLGRARLSETGQPGVDELFQLLPLLVPTPAAQRLSDLCAGILQTPDLHPRWRQRITAILTQIRTWRPEIIDLNLAVTMAERYPLSERREIFLAIVEPLALASIATLTAQDVQRACDVAPDPVEARYLANAIAEHPDSPPPVKTAALRLIEAAFPLRSVWKRLAANRALRVLCVHNIADGQGDEIIRTVPLLQSLLDAHPETGVTLVTDRAYLYGHGRVTTISFDDVARRDVALSATYDVLIDFFEPNVRFLNHGPDLEPVLQELRETANPALDIQASKGMNQFTIHSFRLRGMQWAQALTLDRTRIRSVYDPTLRLIAELGIPLCIGETPPASEPVLACQPWSRADESWTTVTAANTADRPVALLNPFGGGGPYKGFTANKMADLARLTAQLVDEGYFVVIVPGGSSWGSAETARNVIEHLSESRRAQVAVAPDPLERDGQVALDDRGDLAAPYASAVMREFMRFISRADLVVAVEGWMVHAAYALGKPFRVLMLSGSHGEEWQPWGLSASQAMWLFSGDPTLDQPPLPERPRKDAWLALLQYAGDRSLHPVLRRGIQSEDGDIRLAATRALGQTGSPYAVPLLAKLLDDRSHRVRGAAAGILLAHHRSSCGAETIPEPEVLEPYRLIGQQPPDWRAIYLAGTPALPTLRQALADVDPVIRREAAIVLEHLSSTAESTALGRAGALPEREPT